MNRYLYKAKLKETNKWILGYYIMNVPDYEDSEVTHYIITSDNDTVVIDESTLCRCTGKFDVTGKLIFEHDIVEHQYPHLDRVSRYEVMWDDCMCGFKYVYYDTHELLGYRMDEIVVKVVANTIDNPELDPVDHSSLTSTDNDEELSILED